MKAKTKTRKTTGKPRVLVIGGGAHDSIADAGGVAAHVSIGDMRALEAIEHENIHGLLLLGGGDVDPTLYGAQRDGTVYGVSEDRDLIELELVKRATERGIPVMGICRGAQILNVANGGTLWLDIRRDAGAHAHHRGPDHRVTATRGSRLAKAFERPEAWVVSIHHQAVRDVAPGFVATAYANDGIVEAIESVEGWQLGVQFHPEIGRKPTDQRIFDRFVYACGARVGIRPKPKALYGQPVKRAAKTTNAPDTVWSQASDLREWDDVGASSGRTLVAARPTVAERKYAKRSGPVSVTWRCFKGCGVRFDLEVDYVDHMVLLHGEDRGSVES